MILLGAPSVALRGRDGAALGTLIALPAADEDAPQPRFVTSVNRWLLLAAFGSAALAIVLALALSRRILGPIEAVTAAARRMEQSDLGARVTVRSADEIGELARAFNAMAEAVQRSETLRRNLVSDVAHELRTPLTNLRCQIEALQDGLQPPDDKTLRSLHEEALLLARLVDDLQDLTLAEAGQLSLQRGPVRVSAAVDGALTALRPLADQRGLTLHAEAAEDLVVDADRERLAQILRNLLANAVTHTPQGGTITVTAQQDGDDVWLEVADTGDGIAPEHLPHIFDRFYRSDASRARATGGAGLGLAIVGQLVRAHGGRVAATSGPGRGTRVRFSVPAVRG
jgi:two-component system sensor histidine kinase BaeS